MSNRFSSLAPWQKVLFVLVIPATVFMVYDLFSADGMSRLGYACMVFVHLTVLSHLVPQYLRQRREAA